MLVYARVAKHRFVKIRTGATCEAEFIAQLEKQMEDPKISPVYSFHELESHATGKTHLTHDHVHQIKSASKAAAVAGHGNKPVHGHNDSGIFPCGGLKMFAIISDIVLLLQCFLLALVICMNSKEAIDYWGGGLGNQCSCLYHWCR